MTLDGIGWNCMVLVGIGWYWLVLVLAGADWKRCSVTCILLATVYICQLHCVGYCMLATGPGSALLSISAMPKVLLSCSCACELVRGIGAGRIPHDSISQK
jgi:hypothetical protein